MNSPTTCLASYAFAFASVVAAIACFAALAAPSNASDPRAVSALVDAAADALNSPRARPILCEPAPVLVARRFPHDKRQPRPPRHRSERASSYTSELELAASVIDSIIHDDLHRPLLAESVVASPLSGHPLELLRPPSVCA